MSRLVVVVGALGLLGCSKSTPCKTVNMDPLLAGAAAVRVDIYDAGSARCEAGLLAPGAGPPLVSKKFAGGEPLSLSLMPGSRVVVVSTFSDADGTQLTGSSCTNVNLSTGQSSCLSITLTEIDAGSLDFSEPPLDFTTVSPDLTGADLAGADLSGAFGCMSAGDCSSVHGTPQCAGGSCSWTCDPGFAHCQMGNTGCDTDITLVDNCGGCGNVCGTANATANHCMAGACTYDCVTNYLDCIKLGFNQDGCESNKNDVATCGACGNTCDSTHSVMPACDGTKCSYMGCLPGYADCDTTGANANGCEFTDVVHQVGISSLTYTLACTPLGTPGTPTSYSLAMANAACAAWIASVGGGTCAAFGCSANTSCIQASFGGMCATWSYTKSTSGHVSIGGTCSSPNTSAPTWN